MLLLILSAPAFAGKEPVSWPVEIRGIWMDRNSIPKTEDGIREMIRSYAKAGINLVHPEVIFNGRASYKSDVLPQQDLYPGIDMLAILTDEAHKHGIEVHPWVWVFRTGYKEDKGGILTEHPDWAMLDRSGGQQSDNGSYWLSPCAPGVRSTLLSAYAELVQKYPVDGIQLDYIRYPSPDYGYDSFCREGFEREHGVDPLNIEPFTEPVVQWYLWREERINSFVKLVSDTLRVIRPNLKISAAVASFPDQARTNYLQDWENWAANKWVDFLSPMDYTANNLYYLGVVTDEYTKLGDTTLLAPGIGIYTQKGTQTMLDQIGILRSVPVNGGTIFATAYFDKDRIKALQEGPWRTRAGLPFRSPVEQTRDLVTYTAQRLKDAQTPDDLSQATSELSAAQNVLRYTNYMMRDVGHVPPTRPPINIPEHVTPIPEVNVPQTPSAPTIDGKLEDPVWQSAAKVSLDYTDAGGEASQPTEVLLAYDAQNLYIGYRCTEPRTDAIKATVTAHDGPVFYEDSAEFFLNVHPESDSGYYQFATNALGTKYEALVYDTGFSPEWQTGTKAGNGEFVAEMAIPFSAFKTGTPAAGTTWRANFCRNRFTADPNGQNMCWSPTYGSFHTPIRFGRIIFSGEVK